MREIVEPGGVPAISAPAPIPASVLTPDRLDGLDAELCLRLVAAGVDSLEDLASVDPLALAGVLEIGYTRSLRLVSLARRATAPTPAEAPSASPLLHIPSEPEPAVAKFSPSELPWKPKPTILELEWNREIRPQAPPPARTPQPGANAPRSERESAGGPFA
jgi:hypothetical protein